MLPHVAAQQGGLAATERIDAVFGLGDLEASVGVLNQPAPARAELADTGGNELTLEVVDTSERIIDPACQFGGHVGMAGTHHFPELHMVPVLGGIVEDSVLRHRTGLEGPGDDVLNRPALPFGPGDQLVSVVHIGLVVQVMMKLECLLRHAKGGKGIMCIG